MRSARFTMRLSHFPRRPGFGYSEGRHALTTSSWSFSITQLSGPMESKIELCWGFQATHCLPVTPEVASRMHSSARAAVWMKQDVGCLPMGSLKGDDFESQPLTRKEERGGVTYLTRAALPSVPGSKEERLSALWRWRRVQKMKKISLEIQAICSPACERPSPLRGVCRRDL